MGDGKAKTRQRMVYETIKKRITMRVLNPGATITDMQIAEEFGVSRTPVRDALRLLEAEGFLTKEGRKGWKVYTLLFHNVKEIYETKAVIEGWLVRKAALCTDRALRERLKQVFSLL